MNEKGAKKNMTKDEKRKQPDTNMKKEKEDESRKDSDDVDSSNSSSIITELRKVTLEMIESRAEGKTC